MQEETENPSVPGCSLQRKGGGGRGGTQGWVLVTEFLAHEPVLNTLYKFISSHPQNNPENAGALPHFADS